MRWFWSDFPDFSPPGQCYTVGFPYPEQAPRGSKKNVSEIRLWYVQTFLQENKWITGLCVLYMDTFIGLKFIKMSYFTFLRVWFLFKSSVSLSNLVMYKNIKKSYQLSKWIDWISMKSMRLILMIYDTIWNHKTKTITGTRTSIRQHSPRHSGTANEKYQLQVENNINIFQFDHKFYKCVTYRDEG